MPERDLTLGAVGASFLVYGPLSLVAMATSAVAASQVLRRGPMPRHLIGIATSVLVVLWIAACFLAVVLRILGRDWVHLFWSAQIPLVGLFLGSGALLCRTWRIDLEGAVATNPGREPTLPTQHWWSRNGSLLFLAMTVTLGLAPLVLQTVLPEDHPSPRETGAPIRGLGELAAWGLGGSLPATLAPITEEEIARGLGHLPRDITVPMGTTLIGAYLWIAFSLLVLGGRVVRPFRARTAFYLLAPMLLGVLALVGSGFFRRATSGVFDPEFFGPNTSRDSGIWSCDPAVVRSYGPVLAAALASAVVLALCLARDRLTPSPRAGRM